MNSEKRSQTWWCAHCQEKFFTLERKPLLEMTHSTCGMGATEVTSATEEAVKYDEGKGRYDLLPWDAIEEVVRVYTKGALKYADRNWEKGKGLPYSRLFAAAHRHMQQWWGGENQDPEFGTHHLAHAAFCLLGLLHFELTRAAGNREDDRPTADLKIYVNDQEVETTTIEVKDPEDVTLTHQVYAYRGKLRSWIKKDEQEEYERKGWTFNGYTIGNQVCMERPIGGVR